MSPCIHAGNTRLQQLRLLGSSSCTQRDLLPLAALRHLTRLVIGARFVLPGTAGTVRSSGAASTSAGLAALRLHAYSARSATGGHSGSSSTSSRGGSKRPAIDSTFKRMLEGLLPQVRIFITSLLVLHTFLGEHAGTLFLFSRVLGIFGPQGPVFWGVCIPDTI